MRRNILVSILIVALFIPLAWTGCSEDTNGPETYTFERYDENSVPLGTASAYYCDTSDEFNTAANAAEKGDIIYLTDDDVTYVAYVPDGGVGVPWHLLYASIIGTDTNPSEILIRADDDSLYSTTVEFAEDCDIENVDITYHFGVRFHGGDCSIENVIASESNWPSFTISCQGNYPDPASGVEVDITDMSNIDVVALTSQHGAATVYLSDFYHADEACDGNYTTASNALTISSWNYGAGSYSYESIGTPDEENSAVKYCGYPPEKDMYVTGSVPGSQTLDNEDIISVTYEYGPTTSYGSTKAACYSSSEGEWQATWSADSYGANSYCYFRLKVELCDSTYYSNGAKQKVLGMGLCSTPAWYDCD